MVQRRKAGFFKLYDILTPRERIHAIILFFLSLGTAFLQAVGVFSVFPFINVVMDTSIIFENRWLSEAYDRFAFSDPQSFMVALGLCVIVLVVFSNSFTAFTMWAKARFVLNKNHTLSRRLLSVYLSKPYRFFLNRNTSELGKNVLAEINQLTSVFLMAIFDAIINILLIIVVAAMLFLVNAKLTVIALLFMGTVYGIVNVYIKRKLKRKGSERIEANSQRFRVATEALSSIKVSKVMGIESHFINEYTVYSKRTARLNIFAQVAGRLPYYLLESIAFVGIVTLILMALINGQNTATLIPLVSLFAFAGKRMLPALQKFYSAVTQVYYNQAILDKIYDDMYQSSQSSIKPGTATDKPLSVAFDDNIRLRDIEFRYDENAAPVIKQLNLIIPKNSFIGFAGSTGSGKTTLVDIILGLLTPLAGEMTVDDVPITSKNIAPWQAKIGYVPQDIYLSDSSIRHNIAFGIPENKIDDNRVITAAKIAALDDFIQSGLPQKYDTEIGERGVRLSGGQRQRIGLARALYRNPELLVLDEATSSLDGSTEEAVLSAIRNASEERTVIMIAHRLNTLKDCDKIYLVEMGHIIGEGTYDELMAHNKIFQAMGKSGSSEEKMDDR